MGLSRSEAGRLGYLKSKKRIISFRQEIRKQAMRRSAGRRCEKCQKLLPYEKRRNKYCDHRCAAVSINKLRAGIRNCETCGKRLTWVQAKFCSHQCHHESVYRKYIRQWLSGEVEGGSWPRVSSHVRRWLIETRGEKCELCGWCKKNPITKTVPVQVNHKDGNPNNHRPKNLQLLCPNCHSLTSNFGGLNRGNGRKERYASVG